MTSDALYENYRDFGDDPYINAENAFSAWEYAKNKCNEICK